MKEFIETKSNNSCVLLSNVYISSLSKLLIKCACGESFETSLSNFKAGKMKCNRCSRKASGKKRRYTYDYIKNFIEVESNSGCKLLSEHYRGVNEKLSILCSCGNVFEATWGKFNDKDKRRCNDCSYKNCGLTNSLAYEEVKFFIDTKSDCKLLSDVYIDTTTPLSFECKCGNHFQTTFNRFKGNNKRQCNGCSFESRADKSRKTNEEFSNEVYNLILDEYKFLEKYKGAHTKIKCKHNICDYVYNVTPRDFLDGRRCPQCGESKGEQTIRACLSNIKDISFQQEYSFDGLIGVGGRPLRFDFAIFDKNENLISLIEYDGEFHFKQQYEGDGFYDMQIHDKLKNGYCKINSIHLLRIPYWEFENIEKILIKTYQ